MADIELVIKIPEEAYNLLKGDGVDWLGAEHILSCVEKGKVLPNGHGRLKDIDKIKWYGCTSEDDCPYKKRDCKDCNRAECSKTQFDSIPVLIPADKETNYDC